MPELSGSTSAPQRKSMRQIDVLLCVLAPIILASFLISPYLYRSAFWNPIPRQSNQSLKMPAGSKHLAGSARLLCGMASPASDKGEPAPAACAMVTPDDLGPDSTQRIIAASHRLAPTKSPAPDTGKCCCNASNCAVSTSQATATLQPTALDNLRVWQSTFSFPWWNPSKDTISIVFLALLAGICLLVMSTWVTITEEQHHLPTTRALFVFIVVASAAFGYLFIHIIRITVFYAAFFLPQALVTRCAIVLLPPGALTIVLVCLNVGVGLVGQIMENSRREWLARIRALSFIASFAWIGLTGASLFGSWIVTAILGLAYIKHVAIFGWIGTTIASLM